MAGKGTYNAMASRAPPLDGIHYRFINFVVHAGPRVAVITLADPATLNAMHQRMCDELKHALATAEADPNVGAIVITGSGRAFSAGGDTGMMGKANPLSPLETKHFITAEFSGLVEQIRQCPKPVIAAVNGAAVGFAFFLVLSCDMVFAAENAYFNVGYGKLALCPLGVGWVLARKLGHQRAFELVTLCENINAKRGAELGFVNRVTEASKPSELPTAPGGNLPPPDSPLVSAAVAAAARISSGPAVALGMAKKMLHAAHTQSLADHAAWGGALQPLLLADRDHIEAAEALKAKRKPKYSLEALPSKL